MVRTVVVSVDPVTGILAVVGVALVTRVGVAVGAVEPIPTDFVGVGVRVPPPATLVGVGVVGN